MKVAVLVSAFVLSVALALPVNDLGLQINLPSDVPQPRFALLEQLILSALEDVREIIINGNDDVPVLDPLEVHQVNVKGEDFGYPGSHVDLLDVTVKELGTFDVQLEVTTESLLLQRYRFTFDAHIPSLVADAKNYDLYVNVLGYTVFGNGVLSVEIVEPRLSGSCRLSMSIIGGLTFVISQTDLKFTLGAFKPKTTGLFGNDAMSSFVDTFVSYLVPDLVVSYEAEISKFLNEVVTEVGNDLLADLNLSDILG